MKPFFFNRCFEKNSLKALIAWSILNFGERITLNLVEKLKNVGFMYATQAGISLGLDDLKIPQTKIRLISEAEFQTTSTQKEYYQGNLTAVEKFQQLIDTWHRTSELLKQDVIENFKSTDILNPVYMMAFSGARGNVSQVRQLVGMRGLMADPQGQIIDFPIRSNFREGLTLTEYIISCYGARKGLVDTALRTANSGYLTRRLIDVSQHVIIGWMDCGTPRGIFLGDMVIQKKIILPLENRIVGRVLAEDISINSSRAPLGKTQSIALKNQQISIELASKIAKLKKNILVRSPLTCKHKKFLCQFCYGWSLAYGNLVAMGEAVGVLAAQSIGEPGTQLTMRTFHTGGVFSGGIVDEIRAPFDGFVIFHKSLPGKLIRTSYGKIAFFTKKKGEIILYSSTKSLKTSSLNSKLNHQRALEFYQQSDNISHKKIKLFLPESTILFLRNGGTFFKGQLIAEFSALAEQQHEQIRAEHRVHSEIEGQVYIKKKQEISSHINKEIDSLCILSGKIYKSSIASPLFLKKGDILDAQTIINQSVGLTTNTGLISSYFQNQKDEIIDKQNKQIILKQLLQKFCIKTPRFKKFSYFFSFTNSKDLKKVISERDLLFTASNLKENIKNFSKNDRLEWSKKTHLYEWFIKTYQTKTGGILLSHDFILYSFDKFLFWLPEETYSFSSKNLQTQILKKSDKNYFFSRRWSSRELPFFYRINKQGKKNPLYLKLSGFFNTFQNEKTRLNLKINKSKNLASITYIEKIFLISFMVDDITKDKNLKFLTKNNNLKSRIVQIFCSAQRVENKQNYLSNREFNNQDIANGLYRNNLKKLAVFNIKSKTVFTKGFFENPLCLINFSKRIGFLKKQEIIQGLPQRQTPVSVPNLSVKNDPFRFFAKNSKIKKLIRNCSRNEREITFLNFYKKTSIKRKCSGKFLSLFPFFSFFNPKVVQKIKLKNVHPVSLNSVKKENSKMESNCLLYTKNKQLNIKAGWIYFPKNEKIPLRNTAIWKKTKNTKLDNNVLDDLIFDQQIFFPEYFRLGWQAYKKNRRNLVNGLDQNKEIKEADARKGKKITSLFIRNTSSLIETQFPLKKSISKIKKVNKEKSKKILALKLKLNLLYFFSSPSLIECYTKRKKFNRILISCRENQDYNFNCQEKRNFSLLELRNSLTDKKKKDKPGIFNFRKIKNPWVHQNCQLVINYKESSIYEKRKSELLLRIRALTSYTNILGNYDTKKIKNNGARKIPLRNPLNIFFFSNQTNTDKRKKNLQIKKKPQILVLFRKILPYSILDARQYKRAISCTNKTNFLFNSIELSNFTQQKKTKLFSFEPSNDLQIKIIPPLTTHKIESKFFCKITLQRVTISMIPIFPRGLNTISTKITTTRVTHNRILGKIFFLKVYTFTAFCLGNIAQNKILSILKKESWVSGKRPSFFTNFLSPYKGEIASRTSSDFNSRCIVVTNSDQITVSRSSFLVDSKKDTSKFDFTTASITIGQLMRPGEEIALNICLSKSGQIIEIDSEKIVLRRALPVLLSLGSIFHVQHTSFVEKNTELFTLFYQIVKTGDIVQGIPKIEQLFEARGPLIEGREEERQIFPSGLSARFWKIFLKYNKKFSNKLAVRKSFEEIQQIIVQEVYIVYQEQGVYLAEKHLEIIVRQMTSFVLITNPGDTRFLPGEILPLALVEKGNSYLLFLETTESIYQSPYYAQYVPVLFGITKAALRSQGFISAASFQETTRVLSQAAIEKRKDYLLGLKENVVLGRVIPAGTGFPMWRWKFSLGPQSKTENNDKMILKTKLQSIKSRFVDENLDSLIL